ncbi:MAG TPA: VWA domain-containing protein [Terriglobia bacterium]|nr:VWA domain-containing protein [Terriglobia bacterium]
MIKRILATLLMLCALPGWFMAQETKPGTPPSTVQTPTNPTIIRIPVNLVNVPLTVTDKKNRLVIMMTKDDFNLFEDDKPQTIQYFSRETDLALRIGLLIDTSNSIRDRLRFEQQAATDFLSDIIRRGKDQAFVVGFDVEPQLVQDYTDNVEKLSSAIRGLQAGGVTSLYDAIYFSCREKLFFFPPPEPYLRRLMIVISDGDDNRSEHTREEALGMAQRAEVTVFAISTNRSGAGQRGDKILKRLAEETGGKAYFPFEASDLAEDFRAIGRDLRTQFLLSYTSNNTARDGTFRHIAIEPVDKSLHLRAKTGYFAPSQ